MIHSPGQEKSSIDRFWDQYIKVLRCSGAKDSALRWYVLHAEEYIKAFPNRRLARHTRDDLES
ncbi:MAG: hypothetical protein ACRESZ_02745 [Methylococcales bacterium]